MKHCPKCMNEFRDGVDIDICPDCDVPLLDGENPRFAQRFASRPEDSEELVELARFTDQWYVDMVRERLEEEGILTSQVPSEQSALLHLPPVEVTSIIKICVLESNLETARRILADIEAEKDEMEPSPE